jgi:nitrilase
MWIIGGSMPLESPEPGRVYGACIVVDDRGDTKAIYRKIHLFDVDLPDREESYRESHSMYPGNEPMTADTPAGRVGLTVCYDLRFPELFRILVDDGATVFTDLRPLDDRGSVGTDTRRTAVRKLRGHGRH